MQSSSVEINIEYRYYYERHVYFGVMPSLHRESMGRQQPYIRLHIWVQIFH